MNTLLSCLAASAVFTLVSHSAVAYELKSHNCKSILNTYPWVKSTQDYAEAVSQELHATSLALEKEISEANANNEPILVDVVGIGGGPQSAIIFSVMKQLHPQMTSLVFEATHRAGTFDKLSKSFLLNSPENEEFGGLTLRNLLVGAPVQVLDFLSARAKPSPFPSSEYLGNATLLAHYSADAGLIFDQRVEDVRPFSESNGVVNYQVLTRGGLRVFANRIILAPGLGQPRMGIEDRASLELVQQAIQTAEQELRQGHFDFSPGIETVDLFLQRKAEFLRIPEGAHSANQALADIPDEVMVIGGGDGGKAAVEAILGSTQAGGKSHHVLWAGQSALDRSEFLKSLVHPILEKRYPKIASYYDNGTLRAISKKVTKIVEEQENGKRTYEVTLEPRVLTDSRAFLEMTLYGRQPKPSERQVEKVRVQHIIFATGYESLFSDIFQKIPAILENRVTYQDSAIGDYLNVRSNPAQREVPQQVGWRAPEDSIWRIGHGSTSEIPRASHGGPFELGAFGPLSAAMGRLLVNELFTGRSKAPESGLEFIPHQVFSTSKASLQGKSKEKSEGVTWQNQVGAQIRPALEEGLFLLESKVRLGRILNGFHFPGRESFEIQIAVSPTDFTLVAQNMDEKSAQVLGNQLEQDMEFSRLLASHLNGRPGKKLVIGFQSRSDGTPRLETAEFKLQ